MTDSPLFASDFQAHSALFPKLPAHQTSNWPFPIDSIGNGNIPHQIYSFQFWTWRLQMPSFHFEKPGMLLYNSSATPRCRKDRQASPIDMQA